MSFEQHFKGAIDALSMTTVVATLVGLLPAIAAILTIVWTAIRIYETRTVQRIFNAEKKAKEVLEIARIEAKQLLSDAKDEKND